MTLQHVSKSALIVITLQVVGVDVVVVVQLFCWFVCVFWFAQIVAKMLWKENNN